MSIKIKNMFAKKEADDGLRLSICEEFEEYPYPKPEGWAFDEYVDLYVRQLKPPFLAEAARLHGGIDARKHGMTNDAYFLKNCREHYPKKDYCQNMARLIAGYAENHNVTLMCFCPDLSVCHVGIVKEFIESYYHEESPKAKAREMVSKGEA